MGAKRIVGTEDNFVEAPDDRTQLAYWKELRDLCSIARTENGVDDDGNRPFDIRITVEGKDRVNINVAGKDAPEDAESID